MENLSNVNIFLRIRPPQIWETSSPMKTYINYEQTTEKMFILENTPFCFDKIFVHTNNTDIYHNFEPNVDHLLNGYNSCIMAYGQSGAGKTYTMGLNDKNIGLISLCLDSLFQKIRENKETSVDNKEYTVKVSYIEIYNEKVYDLFSEKCSDSIHTKGTKYAGSTKISIGNTLEAKELLLKGNKNRHVRSTLLNATSSRSHAMFTIILTVRSENSERNSVLNLVDLAGSEGLRRTNNTGLAQQEGVNINQGLLAICKVVQALSSGKNLVPYRDSIVTTVLKDCLNLDSYFTLVACISPARKDRNETLSTIRFAQSCKNLDNKMLPEVNAFLKDKQRLEARTPLKPYMHPIARTDNGKSTGKIGTISRKIGTSTVNKSSAAKPFNSFITPSAKKASVSRTRYTDLAGVYDVSHINRLQVPKESIVNSTFNMMNVSSSTEVDGPSSSIAQFGSTQNLASFQQAQCIQSFSPLMRRIEDTIDKKLNTFMESFRNQTTNEVETTVVHKQMKDAVMKGIEEVRKSLDIQETVMADSTFELTNPICSTVARAPQNSNQNSTVQNVQNRRTNRRLMTVDLTQNSPHKFTEGRTSNEVQIFNASLSQENKTVIRPTRRSTRIFEMKQIMENKENKAVKIEHKVAPTKKRQVIKNEIVASYYTNSAENFKNITKKDHKNAIMDMINKGTVNDLKVLPTIGSKTAYQLVSYRAVKGHFKTLDDVKKALMFTEKKWDKFLEANLLK